MPDPLPIAETMREALHAAVDRLERPARTIDDTVSRTTGLRLAPDTGAAARAAGLIVGVVAGVLGVWGGFSLLTAFASIGLITAGANGARDDAAGRRRADVVGRDGGGRRGRTCR